MKTKAYLTLRVLFILMTLENLCLYYFFRQGILTTGKNAWLLFASSMLFGIVYIYRFYDTDVSVNVIPPKRKKLAYILVLLFVAGLVWLAREQVDFLNHHSIENAGSDVVPSVCMMARRFLGRVNPYTFVNGCNVGYYPFHWLPFTIAAIFHFEYRMVPFLIWSIAALWLVIRSTRANTTALQILSPLIVWASYYALFTGNNTIIEATVEVMIGGYYMALMTSISTGKAVLQGIIFSLCLLSRFSLILWMPLYVFTLVLSGHRRQLFITAATSALIVLCVFVPYATGHTELLATFKGYDGPAMFEWGHMNCRGYPMHLWSGTGFAYYIYTRYAALDLLARIRLLQHIHFTGCCAITIMPGIWYWFNKDRIDYRLFLLGSFKLYISVFLFFIQVPYVYLMSVGNFITVALFCEQMRYKPLPFPLRRRGKGRG